MISKNIKKLSLYVFVVMLSLILIYADSKIKEKQIVNNEIKTIKIGLEYWPGYSLIFIADKLGYFKEENIDVKISMYDNFKNLESDFNSGIVDARGAFPSDVILDYYKKGEFEKIVLITDYSLGGDALASRKDYIYTKGNKVRIGTIGYVDFLTLWFVNKNNINKSDVVYVNFDSVSEASDAFKLGDIDYLVTYDPYLSDVVNFGGKVLYSSADDPGVITDVISFNNKYIENNKAALKGFARAYFKAYDYWKEHKLESSNMVKDGLGIEVNDLNTQLSKIKLLSLDDNNNSLNIITGLKSLYSNLRIINSFLQSHDPKYGLIKTDELIYSDVIKILVSERNNK